ncbi:hypothetical protein DFH29DRAFT_1026772 [Suillus ampliporus]|nr:hypothetical protein DFH29DRAFT_1026772 [Suillus ampliporus]
MGMLLICSSTPHNIFQMKPEIANDQGIGYSIISMNNTANFLAFLEELRQNPVGANLTLSAAIGLAPFFDTTGNPATDTTEFAKVFDYIAVMNYDIWDPWFLTVGLNNLHLAYAERPTHWIVLSVGSYGHSFSIPPSGAFTSSTKTLTAFPTFNASNQPLGNT